MQNFASLGLQNYASLRLQKPQPLPYGFSPVARAVFHSRVQLGIGYFIAIRDKDGVVAKAILSDGLVGDDAVQAACEKMSDATMVDKAEAGGEMGGAVVLALHVLKYQLKVGHIITMAAGVAG